MHTLLSALKSAAGIFAFVFCILLSTALIIFYKNAATNLKRAAYNLRTLGRQYITDTIYIEDTIPIDTRIEIKGEVPVNIQMNIQDSVPIALQVNFSDTLRVPVALSINQTLQVDALLRLPDSFNVTAKAIIPVQQKVQVKSLAGINLRVKTDVPVDRLFLANIAGSLKFISAIPVNMKINDTIFVQVDKMINVKDKIGISLPINRDAVVSFVRSVPVKGFIPLHLKVPVVIPISETPIKKYLDSTANNLDAVFKF